MNVFTMYSYSRSIHELHALHAHKSRSVPLLHDGGFIDAAGVRPRVPMCCAAGRPLALLLEHAPGCLSAPLLVPLVARRVLLLSHCACPCLDCSTAARANALHASTHCCYECNCQNCARARHVFGSGACMLCGEHVSNLFAGSLTQGKHTKEWGGQCLKRF
jgi:hypothetical protein